MLFTKVTKDGARFRQSGRCGMCGTPLDDIWEEAHHIEPNHLDGPDEVDNCVVLCGNCHYHAHDGKYRSGIVPTAEAYPYLNG
jgi:5-methylcytosine-specific restriction endonuclease McrA